MRKLHKVTLVVVAAALVITGAAVAQEKATFTGTVLQTQNMRLPAGGTFQIKIVVEQWTSVEERQRLLGVFIGPAAVRATRSRLARETGCTWCSWALDQWVGRFLPGMQP